MGFWIADVVKLLAGILCKINDAVCALIWLYFILHFVNDYKLSKLRDTYIRPKKINKLFLVPPFFSNWVGRHLLFFNFYFLFWQNTCPPFFGKDSRAALFIFNKNYFLFPLFLALRGHFIVLSILHQHNHLNHTLLYLTKYCLKKRLIKKLISNDQEQIYMYRLYKEVLEVAYNKKKTFFDLFTFYLHFTIFLT